MEDPQSETEVEEQQQQHEHEAIEDFAAYSTLKTMQEGELSAYFTEIVGVVYANRACQTLSDEEASLSCGCTARMATTTV